MFNVQGSEIIIILLVALIVLGPEKLPDAIRRFTKMYGEFRKMSSGFQSELRNALDEPMRELRDTADLVRKNADFRDLVQNPGPSKPVSATPAAAPTMAAAKGLDIDPVNAAEQASAPEPVEAAELPEPVEAAEPVEPAEAVEPVAPAEPVESTDDGAATTPEEPTA